MFNVNPHASATIHQDFVSFINLDPRLDPDNADTDRDSSSGYSSDSSLNTSKLISFFQVLAASTASLVTSCSLQAP